MLIIVIYLKIKWQLIYGDYMGFTSIWHWVIVLIVVLVLFGGKGKLSALMGDFGKGLKNFKDQIKSKNDKIEEKPLKKANKTKSTKAKKSKKKTYI